MARDLSPARRLNEVPVLAALVAVVAGFVWLAALAAPEPPGDASAEAGFARDMTMHHAQAVEMAELVRAKTSDPEVRILATDIALTQQAQIGMFAGWLQAWGLRPNGSGLPMAWFGHGTDEPMPGMATRAEVNALAAAAPGEADRQFLSLMIPHHRAGVLMARAVLARTERPEVVLLAESIAGSQQAEIANMEALLVRLGASPVTRAVTMPAGEPGHGHSDGWFTAVAPARRAAARLLPVAVGLFAAVWLVADAARRRKVWASGPAAVGHPGARSWQVAGVTTLAVAGVLHLALAPEHYEASTAHGTFFVLAGCAQLALAAALLAWPSLPLWVAAVPISAALVALYAASRLVALPVAGEREALDAVGLAVQGMQLATLAVAVREVRRRTAAARVRAEA